MGYAVHARDGAWPPNAPQDGEPIGWHYRARKAECEGGEVYVEEIPENLSEPRWDASEGAPRARTEQEVAQDERGATVLRVAGEAEKALTQVFVNPNDALVLVAAALHKTSRGEELSQGEAQALAVLNQAYEKGLEEKLEIAQADPKDLSAIHWDE